MVPVNYLAVLVCGFAAMGLGTLWYGPLFGKAWMASSGMPADAMDKMRSDPKGKQKMMRSYGIMFVCSLIMAFVLSHVMVFSGTYLQESSVSAGIQGGFWMWLGFVATTTIGMVLWEMKSWKYWAIVSGYYLADLLLMGLILGLWM